MKAGRASLTALAVATARGIGTGAFAPAPTAAAILPAPVAAALRGWQSLPRWARASLVAPRLLSGGVVDHITLRTRAIDQAVREAVERDAEQLVILGAGYDGRAHRMTELRSVRVFEVDHPATAAVKQARARTLPACAAEIRYAGIDFDQEALGPCLAAAGHDAERPTVWIWEGVTPYLPLSATTASLAALAERSPPGSTLVMTYAVPQLTGGDHPRLEAVVRRGFSWLGEPLRGALEPADAAELVRKYGFQPESDTGQDAWARDDRLAYALARPLRSERLLIAARLDRARV
ncbi:MAG: SAM-dependent methyltransferase [Myxococcota bacterium]